MNSDERLRSRKEYPMRRSKYIQLGAVTAIATVTVLAAACSTNTASEATATSAPTGSVGSQPANVPTGQTVSNGAPGSDAARSSTIAPVIGDYGVSYSYPYQSGGFSSGIVVSGIGMKSMQADMGIVYLGVEARALTVSEARQDAANAMTAVRDALKGLGIADKDIVTTNFNIYPETTWIEIKDSLGTRGQSKIIGYVVNNAVEIKVRKLDDVGAVIDAAAEKGGDLIRVNSVAFTLADPNAASVELRELAAKDAKAKAEIYAKAMGVTLGQLVYLSESGSSAPVVKTDVYYARAEGAADAFAPSPVSGGAVEMNATVSAVFAIVP